MKSMDTLWDYERGKKMEHTMTIVLLTISIILLVTGFIMQSLIISRLNKLVFELSMRSLELKVELNSLKDWATFRTEEVQGDFNQEGASENDTEGKI